nr:hypothetical protein [Peteryoungia ipomoeae]
MQEFDRHGSAVCRKGGAVAAGGGDREAEAGPYARTTGKHGVSQSLREDGRTSTSGRVTQGALHAGFYALGEIHKVHLQ